MGGAPRDAELNPDLDSAYGHGAGSGAMSGTFLARSKTLITLNPVTDVPLNLFDQDNHPPFFICVYGLLFNSGHLTFG